MKSERDVRQCVKARRKHIIDQATYILSLVGHSAEELSGSDMQALRDTAEELLQDVHEFNAYRNVLLGGGPFDG